jgi:hypothetical protein
VQFLAGAPALTTVNWQQAIGGQDFCGSYQNVRRLSVPYGVPPVTGGGGGNPLYTARSGGFLANGVIVVSFTVPAGEPARANAGSTQMAEYNGPAVFRHMTLSKSSCDFRTADPTGTNGPFVATQNGSAPSITWNVGNAPVALVAGQTYYFSFRNWNDLIGPTCLTTACEAFITFNWPY